MGKKGETLENFFLKNFRKKTKIFFLGNYLFRELRCSYSSFLFWVVIVTIVKKTEYFSIVENRHPGTCTTRSVRYIKHIKYNVQIKWYETRLKFLYGNS